MPLWSVRWATTHLTRRQRGFDTFAIVAHDRGARVAHRLALDHPGQVTAMMLLDIAPTLWMYETTRRDFVRPSPAFTSLRTLTGQAMGYWHWFFYPQPSPGPVRGFHSLNDRIWPQT